MMITPFLTIKLCRKKDTLRARQYARRAAQLLGFAADEQACIAAGAFVIACQALERFGQARLFFQIDERQLQVHATELHAESGNRLATLLNPVDLTGMFRLVKPLPVEQNVAERDLGWLVHKVDNTADDGVFAEIVKQNQEMLALLHELRLYQGSKREKGGNSSNPHAA